jgi:hypothetical protein
MKIKQIELTQEEINHILRRREEEVDNRDKRGILKHDLYAFSFDEFCDGDFCMHLYNAEIDFLTEKDVKEIMKKIKELPKEMKKLIKLIAKKGEVFLKTKKKWRCKDNDEADWSCIDDNWAKENLTNIEEI